MFGLFIAVFIGIGLVSKEVERRSIYALLAKPIHRYQLVLGKYCGLVLTLAVNVAVMAAALYLVLAYMAWGVAPEIMRAWDAPALDPALLKAVGADPRRADAGHAPSPLFFSTFSTPILSAALTFGFFIVGHFSTDLRNFKDVVDSSAAAGLARGSVLVLPNLAQFDVKSAVAPGKPSQPGTWRSRRPTASPTSGCCSSCRWRSSRDGTSSDARRSRSPARWMMLLAVVQLQAARERRLSGAGVGPRRRSA